MDIVFLSVGFCRRRAIDLSSRRRDRLRFRIRYRENVSATAALCRESSGAFGGKGTNRPGDTSDI